MQFNSMVQINEDTGNRRPIMLSLPLREDKDKEQQIIKEAKKEKDPEVSKSVATEGGILKSLAYDM